MEIGRDTEDPQRQFHEIVGAVALPARGVAVVDRASQMLRIFDSVGRPAAAAGGEGQGPGESQYIWSMARSGLDSLLVMDESAIEVFSTDGKYLGSSSREVRSSLLDQPDVSIDPLLLNTDGSVLAMVFEPRAGRSAPTNEPFRPNQGWALIFRGFEEAAFLGWYPGYLVERLDVGSEVIQLSPPFHTATVIAAGGTPLRIVVGDSEVSEVRVFDSSGELERISRWTPTSRETRMEWVEMWKEEVRYTDAARRRLPQLEVAWARMHVPDRLPFFQALAVDSENNLWIQEARAPTDSAFRYTVFDPEGRWLGSLPVPVGLIHTVDHPVDIGPDYFLGVWHDELGIQSVRRYGLIKPSTESPSDQL